MKAPASICALVGGPAVATPAIRGLAVFPRKSPAETLRAGEAAAQGDVVDGPIAAEQELDRSLEAIVTDEFARSLAGQGSQFSLERARFHGDGTGHVLYGHLNLVKHLAQPVVEAFQQSLVAGAQVGRAAGVGRGLGKGSPIHEIALHAPAVVAHTPEAEAELRDLKGFAEKLIGAQRQAFHAAVPVVARGQ